MELFPKEIQMELDLRGSELCDDTVKENGKGQRSELVKNWWCIGHSESILTRLRTIISMGLNP